jgi:nitrous oxide reductase accessory protein NosL
MKKMKSILMALCLSLLVTTSIALAEPLEDVAADSRCKVCGMFVAKYPNWLSQIHTADGNVALFDGVKDMMVFYFNPEKYEAKTDAIKDIWVKDYYTMKWLDGRQAFYVVGSDVHGPMGHEFIPFASQEAAQSFLKDHHGNAVLTFGEITSKKVESMRMGMKMKKMKMNMK